MERKKLAISFGIVILMIFSSFTVLSANQSASMNSTAHTNFVENERKILCSELGPRTKLPYRVSPGKNISGGYYEGEMNVSE